MFEKIEEKDLSNYAVNIEDKGYSGPYFGKFLWYYSLNQHPILNLNCFENINDAIKKANEIKDECGGITFEDRKLMGKVYTLRKTNELHTTPEPHINSGKFSYLKKL